MKINKVILSSDSNILYIDFWESVSKVWKEKFNIDPILLLVSNDNIDMDQTYGKVLRFNIIEELPIYLQTLWIRYWATSLFEDDICIISDIDMYPLSKQYFIDQIKDIDDDKYVHINPCYQSYGTLPSCYHIAKGSLYKEILNLHDKWEDSINHLFNLNIGRDPGGVLSSKNHWFADEIYSSNKIFNYKEENPDKIKFLYREEGRRIDRSSWFYDEDKLSEGWYYDSHSIRPYDRYEELIQKMISKIQ